MSPWDGKERRDKTDHDLLTRIDERMEKFVLELEELKQKVGWHDKLIFMSLGGIAVLQIIFKVFK